MSKPKLKLFEDSFVLWIALRNLVSRSGLGLSFMTWVSIAGVAVGVAALIIVLSVMGGFEQSLRSKMLGNEPHIEIFAENATAGFSLNEFPIERLRGADNVDSFEAFTKADVVLKHRKHLQSAELLGLDPQLPDHLWSLTKKMTSGSLGALGLRHNPRIAEDGANHQWPGIVVGEGLAGNLGVDLGDEVIIINPGAATDAQAAMSGATSVRHYVLVGTFRSGDSKFDSKYAVVSLAEGRRFMADYDPSLQTERYVAGIGVNLVDPFKSEVFSGFVGKLGAYQAVSWKEANQSLLFALKLEKFAMGSILMLIVVVAAFSISGTMMMTVFHRRTQVSLLRSLGFTKKSIAKLYLAHGFAIGTVGMILGAAIGLGVCVLIHQLEFIDLPAGIYYQHKLPVKFIPDTYIVICLFAWMFSLVASTYPALTAAQQSPSEGLRFE